MRSLIIIEVEHDDTTDALQDFVESLDAPVGVDWFGDGSVFVKDYTIRVDVPECFRLDK